MKYPFVSIILLGYNSEKDIKETIQNLGENVDIQGAVTLTLPDGTTTCTATPATATLQSGQPLPLALSCGLVSVFGADEAVRGNLLVVYRKTSGGTLDQRSTGTLRGTAQ